MPIKFKARLEDVNGYNGKNGYGANITASMKVTDDNGKKRTKRLEFRISDKNLSDKLENHLDEILEFEIQLEQNNFGLRFGELICFDTVKVQEKKVS